MRRSVGIVLALVSVLLLGATAVTYSKYKKSQDDFVKATAEQETMRQRYDQAVNEIVSIQDSLNTIVLKQNEIPTDVEPGSGGSMTGSSRGSRRSSRRSPHEGADQPDEREIKHSGVRIAGMKRVIETLLRHIGPRGADRRAQPAGRHAPDHGHRAHVRDPGAAGDAHQAAGRAGGEAARAGDDLLHHGQQEGPSAPGRRAAERRHPRRGQVAQGLGSLRRGLVLAPEHRRGERDPDPGEEGEESRS